MREEIKAKADKLGQMYFPDECNVWARDNIEAKFVSSACMEMAEWMQKTMIEKACEWMKESLPSSKVHRDREKVLHLHRMRDTRQGNSPMVYIPIARI